MLNASASSLANTVQFCALGFTLGVPHLHTHILFIESPPYCGREVLCLNEHRSYAVKGYGH